MSQTTDHLRSDPSFFAVLYVHRDDVADALRMDDPEQYENENGDPNEDAFALAAAITDRDMFYLADKVGDVLMQGGDFYESLALIYHDLYGRAS